MINDTILIIPEMPTFVDSLACNLAVKIDEIVSGINERTIIWRPKTPSWNFGKNSLMTIGANKIATIVIPMELTRDQYVILLCAFPL